MSADKVVEVSRILGALSRELDALERAAGEIPAVERNVVRMRGTLRALEIQFEDLAAMQEGGG